MSVEQAQGLIQKAASDADFRAQLEAAPVDRRRAVLVEHGFGDVRLRHLSQALPESGGGELSDEEFAAVAGGDDTGTDVAEDVGGAAPAVAVAAAAAAAA